MPADNVSINLLGESEMEHTPVGRIVSWAVTYGRYIMIGTEIVVLLAFISRFSLDRKLTDLKDEISQKQDIIQANVQFEGDVRTLQNKLAKIKSLSAAGTNPVNVLSGFETLMPSGVYLQNFSLTGNTLTVDAVANSTQAFSQFVVNLESSSLLTNIDINKLTRDPILGIQFSFTATVGQPKG